MSKYFPKNNYKTIIIFAIVIIILLYLVRMRFFQLENNYSKNSTEAFNSENNYSENSTDAIDPDELEVTTKQQDGKYPYIVIVSKIDSAEVSNIVINRGNCDVAGYEEASLKYGDVHTVLAMCMKVLSVDFELNGVPTNYTFD